MGEGWGDFFATQIRKTREVPSGGSGRKYPHVGEPMDFPMGAWAANRAGGIRNYPYSLNATVNPSTYKTLDKGGCQYLLPFHPRSSPPPKKKEYTLSPSALTGVLLPPPTPFLLTTRLWRPRDRRGLGPVPVRHD